jgi:hypothetical protein
MRVALPYKWTQDLNTVTVSVPLPAGTRGKDCTVILEKKKLKVIVCAESKLWLTEPQVQVKGSSQAILDGELFNEIAKDDSSWTIRMSTLSSC